MPAHVFICIKRADKNKPVYNTFKKQKPELNIDAHGLSMVLPHCGLIVRVRSHWAEYLEHFGIPYPISRY